MAVKILLPYFVNVEVHVTTPYWYSQIYYIENFAKVGVRTGFGIAFFLKTLGPQKPLWSESGVDIDFSLINN